MRKRLAMIMAALTLIMVLFVVPVAAAEAVVEIRAPSKMPRAGDTFPVSVEITGNPGINVVQFTLHYNNEQMVCTEAEAGPLVSGMLYVTNPNAPDGAIVAAASVSPVRGDGTLATFVFQALKEVENFEFSLLETKFCASDGSDIPITVKNGTTDSQEAATPTALPSPAPSPTPAPSGSGGTSGATGGGTRQQTTPSPQPTEDPTPSLPVLLFSDTEGHWGESYINRAVEIGLFTGYEDGSFHPDEEITRADFVTVLWRAADEPEPTQVQAFDDVPTNMYYSKAIAWAKEKGYVNGRSTGQFDPFGTLTRQEAMKIVFGCSGGHSGMETMFIASYDENFTDSGDIADWAKPAMYWAYYNEIISGTGNSQLSPVMGTTRSQIAKILVNYLEKTGVVQ